jgi:hydroxyacyl-ACP dehydratase HTD2-like protein with hotdog domain
MNRLLEQSMAASFPVALPELVVTPDHMQIFMFSAITWNRHHVHYSKDAALDEGLPDVVVQRALLGNFIARAVTDWAGEEAEIRELSWKVLSSATPGMRLLCQGSLTATETREGREFGACELKIIGDDDKTVASGTARLEFTDPLKPQ